MKKLIIIVIFFLFFYVSKVLITNLKEQKLIFSKSFYVSLKTIVGIRAADEVSLPPTPPGNNSVR